MNLILQMSKIRLILVNLVLIFALSGFMTLTAFAGDAAPAPAETSSDSPAGTILPATKKSVRECKDIMNDVNTGTNSHGEVDAITKFKENTDQAYINQVLACGIKTGSIRLWMVPYYIRYILQFIVGLSGLVAVGGIIYGGYLYLFAGVSDDKDKGKKAIEFGIVGLVLTLVAWAIVNIVISVVSG